MSKFDSDGSAENDWDERGELAWNEFDWERYLREQDEAITRYIAFYDAAQDEADRIDAVAEKMNWGRSDWTDEGSVHTEDEDEDDEDDDDFIADNEVYTLHKNPIFIATKGIYLSLRRRWELIAGDSTKVPQSLAVSLLSALNRGEEQASLAIHALDFGDYAMAVSLFKRALSALNEALALLSDDTLGSRRAILAFRDDALPRLFDLREIWLRVIAECRDELKRPNDSEN